MRDYIKKEIQVSFFERDFEKIALAAREDNRTIDNYIVNAVLERTFNSFRVPADEHFRLKVEGVLDNILKGSEDAKEKKGRIIASKADGDFVANFEIFETEFFFKGFSGLINADRKKKMVQKLKEHVYPILRKSPFEGKSIKKMRKPKGVRRFNVQAYQFFYEINLFDRVVYMIAFYGKDEWNRKNQKASHPKIKTKQIDRKNIVFKNRPFENLILKA